MALGKRCSQFMNLVLKWEAYHGRNCVIDSIMVLRHVLGVSAESDRIEYILKTLFIQQRAGLRSTLRPTKSKNDVKTVGNITKSLLLTRMIYVHCQHQFPNLQDIVEPFLDGTYILNKYGVDQDGRK